MSEELRYVAEDDDDWPPREDAMQAFQVVKDEEAPANHANKMPETMPRPKSPRVDLVRFLESLTVAELASWLGRGHVRMGKG